MMLCFLEPTEGGQNDFVCGCSQALETLRFGDVRLRLC